MYLEEIEDETFATHHELAEFDPLLWDGLDGWIPHWQEN